MPTHGLRRNDSQNSRTWEDGWKFVRFFSGQSQGLALSSQARVHCLLEAVNSVTLDWGTTTQHQSLSPDDSLFGFLLIFLGFNKSLQTSVATKTYLQINRDATLAFTWSYFLQTGHGKSQKERASVTFTGMSEEEKRA